MNRLLLLALTSLWFGNAAAATHTTVCNGCSASAMLQAATRVTSKGTVYVLNATNASARKFSVETEIISLKPYWAFTYADELTIESDVATAFNKFATSQQGLRQSDLIILPPDFPIRSVAGAFLDPNASTIRVVDYLRGTPTYQQLEITVTALFAAMLKRNIPMVNLSDVVKQTKIIVEFADGSTLEYEIYFTINALTAEASLEITPIGNARLYDGAPAPTSAYGFRDFFVDNTSPTIYEWALWAARNGVTVYDGSNGRGTRMSCHVSGSSIRCTVTLN